MGHEVIRKFLTTKLEPRGAGRNRSYGVFLFCGSVEIDSLHIGARKKEDAEQRAAEWLAKYDTSQVFAKIEDSTDGLVHLIQEEVETLNGRMAELKALRKLRDTLTHEIRTTIGPEVTP